MGLDRVEWHAGGVSGSEFKSNDACKLKAILMIEDIGQHFIVSLKGTWDDYLKSLSHKFRKDLSRSLRQIREAGEVGTQCFSGKQIKWEHFETIFQINEFGRFPHLYRNPQERDFQKELLELTSNHQWLNIQFLYLQTVPIAYRYGFVFRNRFEAWRNGFDTRFSQYGPGKVLHALTLDDKFGRQLQEFDFLLGDEPHKEHWGPNRYEFLRLRAVSPRHLFAALTYVRLPRLRIPVE